MRYSQEHKAQNHEKILSVAARSFREHGGDSSGIGTVMKKVGLTKGASTGILRVRTTCSSKRWHGHSTRREEVWWRLQSPRPKVRLCGPSSNAI